jgi:hypothetical protein
MAMRRHILLGCLLAVGATGCGAHGGPGAGEMRHPEYPAWVTRGSGFFVGDVGPAFIGVGVVSGIRNGALARTTADNRARAEAAKLFEQFAVTLMADYQAQQPPPPTTAETNPADEAHPEQNLKAMTAATLNSIQVVDHWLHPGDGGVYALARLDLRALTDNVTRLKDVNESVRDYVKRNAEPLHAKFEQAQARAAGVANVGTSR